LTTKKNRDRVVYNKKRADKNSNEKMTKNNKYTNER